MEYQKKYNNIVNSTGSKLLKYEIPRSDLLDVELWYLSTLLKLKTIQYKWYIVDAQWDIIVAQQNIIAAQKNNITTWRNITMVQWNIAVEHQNISTGQ